MATAALRISGLSVTQPKIKKMPLERFRQWRSHDGWKYDWNNGEISKYKKIVTEEQRYIVRNIERSFHKTKTYADGHDLMSETEMSYDDKRYRIPDIAFYTYEQTKAAASSKHTVSSFVIEILSNTDFAKDVENKLWEYFDEGVKVVWQIMPYRKLVKVYTSPFHVKVCIDTDVCSSKPALVDFEMTVNQIFELKD